MLFFSYSTKKYAIIDGKQIIMKKLNCQIKKRGIIMAQNSCESCTYYTYDEDYESYMCDINMDEDEYMRLISDQHYQCPYYRNGDEYMVVRKQM